MMKNLISLLLVISVCLCAEGKIDRKALTERNNPIVNGFDKLNSLSVGNGHFATTVDVTGLQSFPTECETGVPLCAMSDWGWHSFPNVENLKPEDTQRVMDLGHGRKEVFAVEYKTAGRNKQATDYFRINPHRLNLGNLALQFIGKNGEILVSECIGNANQTLHLYDGNITSTYSVMQQNVDVTTACMPCDDALIARISTKLFKQNNAQLCFSLPYVTGQHADAASEWNKPAAHTSRIIQKGTSYVIIQHDIDATTYFIRLSWEGKASVSSNKPHTYIIKPKGNLISVKVEYVPQVKMLTTKSDFAKDLATVKSFWNNWWETGAVADFSECTDTRAKELERRVVLSQYITYINCANETPAQETGLTYNSWFGRPHLEMTWWHTVDFSLWNRPEVMEQILEWYNDKAYPMAKEIAERQHFKGIRWMKMTDPWVGESPSNVGSFLTWQQPHYIYMAEEMYRHNPSADVLAKYGKYVEETALFMADFAKACSKNDNGPIKLFGQTAAQESMSKDFSYNHPFEQVYWVYGLTTAQKWRERQGKGRIAEWDDIIKRMSPLAEHNGIYTGGEPSQPFVDAKDAAPGSNSSFDPFNYNSIPSTKQMTEADFYAKACSDHPAVLGACGMLPDYGLYDRAEMQRTLNWVMENWNWDTTWGWDYGMTAMCAARLGDGEQAVNALLIDKGKNTYLVSGHNFQEPKRLRLYLPGNGALLDAVAMMCAGWDGCPDIKNPGFPRDGKWNVKWEGLNKMQ